MRLTKEQRLKQLQDKARIRHEVNMFTPTPDVQFELPSFYQYSKADFELKAIQIKQLAELINSRL